MPEDLYYDRDHFWVRVEGDVLVMGMDDFAQKMAGDIVFVQLPFEGKKMTAGKKFAKVESGKWVGKVFAPVNGELAGSNQALETNPKLINQDCYGEGWMYKIKPAGSPDLSNLVHGAGAIEEMIKADVVKYSKE